MHGWGAYDFTNPIFRWIGRSSERKLASWTDRIVFVNEYDRLRAVALGITTERQSLTIYNGVPEARLAPGRTVDRRELLGELGLGAEAFLCVFVGRLARQKGLPYLLQATAAVKAQLPSVPVHVAMVGEGVERVACQEHIARLDIGDRVHLLGFRRDAIRWTGGCDLFLLPSLWEGHSITLLEAMGLGRPIVATDIPGTRESLTHGHDGLLVPPGDADALGKAIADVVTNRQEAGRLGAAAAETFHARFTEGA